jgi:uncharacterized surface protein with fasciclin (FAS1) repeats
MNTAVQPASAPVSAPEPNLIDMLAAKGNFTAFVRAVEAADLDALRAGAGPVTVLAPTDLAFSHLPSGALARLLRAEHRTELVALLNNHLLVGRRSVADLARLALVLNVHGRAPAIQRFGGRVTIDGAHLTTTDMVCRNAWVHGIDKVNVPPAVATR